MVTAALQLKSVGKRFPGVVALKGVSLELAKGETHALLGENGAGKSTLIGLLAGIHRPDEGQIILDGAPYQPANPTAAHRAGVRVVHQELHMLSNLTVAENILFEHLPQRRGLVDRRALNDQAAALLCEVGLDVSPTMPASALGVSQMQLVEIAKALTSVSKLLILDEPTATLTPREVDRLFGILRGLKSRQVTILYVSHRLREIAEICDRMTVLRDGAVVGARPVEGTSIPEIIQMMVGRAVEEQGRFRDDVVLGDEVLRVAALRRGTSFPEISFSIRRGEILGIAGLVGSGRTEAMRSLFGADPKHSGKILVDGEQVAIAAPHDAVRHGIGMLTEDRKSQGLLLGMGCAENITITDLAKISRAGLIQGHLESAAAKHLVGELRIKTPSIRQIVRTLSGGNQQKVVLAKWLFRGSKVLICDEPTRGVDVGAKAEIYELLWALAAKGKGIVCVSSDLAELMAICHRIIVFAKDAIAGELARPEFDQRRILELAYKEIGHDVRS